MAALDLAAILAPEELLAKRRCWFAPSRKRLQLYESQGGHLVGELKSTSGQDGHMFRARGLWLSGYSAADIDASTPPRIKRTWTSRD